LKSIHGSDRYKEIASEQLFELYPEEIARGLEDESIFDLQRFAEDTAREEQPYDEENESPFENDLRNLFNPNDLDQEAMCIIFGILWAMYKSLVWRSAASSLSTTAPDWGRY
jgi:hypothetical protein